ncbi:hypothetical protein ADUPG1_003816, partial [Aduncisulcus paluster]
MDQPSISSIIQCIDDESYDSLTLSGSFRLKIREFIETTSRFSDDYAGIHRVSEDSSRNESSEDENTEELAPHLSSSCRSITAQPIDRALPDIIPIPRDDPTLVFAWFKYMKLEHAKPVEFPFPKPSSTKGAYIWISDDLSSRQLIVKFTSSSGGKISNQYTFPRFRRHQWFYLPIEIPNIVSFEALVVDSKKKTVLIQYLAFVREETPEESTF